MDLNFHNSFYCRFRVKSGELTVTFREPIKLVSVWIGARRGKDPDSSLFNDYVARYHHTKIFMNDEEIGTGFKIVLRFDSVITERKFHYVKPIIAQLQFIASIPANFTCCDSL